MSIYLFLIRGLPKEIASSWVIVGLIGAIMGLLLGRLIVKRISFQSIEKIVLPALCLFGLAIAFGIIG